MGIKSTQTIDRLTAIRRIKEINELAINHQYAAIEKLSWERDENIASFVDNHEPIQAEFIDNWTDKMLEDVMDKPFFRFSMFDNYTVYS